MVLGPGAWKVPFTEDIQYLKNNYAYCRSSMTLYDRPEKLTGTQPGRGVIIIVRQKRDTRLSTSGIHKCGGVVFVPEEFLKQGS